jgi:ABC-type transport system substrate-binding protein
MQIFQNGMGVELHGVVPEGIFGYQGGQDGMNPYVFDWDAKRGRPVRKSLDHAHQLLAEAGYPGGVGSDGQQLVVHYDNSATGGGADAYFRWLRRQFGKLNIAVVNRTTDYSTFAKRAENGEVQMFYGGWLPDYPDPENFLFMLYGPNGLMKHHGANSANYESEEYDRLFRKMLAMPNSPERHEIIQQMQRVLHQDMPWFSIRQGATFSLAHHWVKNSKTNVMAFNWTKYLDVDAGARNAYRLENNRPVRWPLYATAGLLLVVVLPALRRRIRKEQG